MEENYSDERVSHGMRIKFNRSEHLMESQKVYSNGERQVRILIDTNLMEFKLVDAVTGFVLHKGGDGVNNLEVLQRHVKKELVNLLNIHFEKEVRNTQSTNE